jgi:arginyl-tRNA synthetase
LKSLLEQLLRVALRRLAVPGMADTHAIFVGIERTRDAAHGAFTSNVAMRLAKAAGQSPRKFAQALVAALPESPGVASAEVAGNGFINFFIAPDAMAREIAAIHEAGEAYGHSSLGAGEPAVTVGLISNPQSLQEGRYAAYTESLASVLTAVGHDVKREPLNESPPIRAVTLCRGKDPVQMSTLRELRDVVGDDACRFFFLTRSHDHTLEFDVKLATTRTNENPLYCAQYAQARAASAMKEVKAREIPFDLAAGLEHLALLDKNTEQALIATLLRLPEEVESAATNCAPHSIVYYLRDVANAFHTYYNAEQWIVDEQDLRNARLALVLAARQVLRNGFALIGISAPESM